eukprot:11935656-Alexandrium_andersonii.AAC.1
MGTSAHPPNLPVACHASKMKNVTTLQALPTCPPVRHEADRAHVIWFGIGTALRLLRALQLNPLRCFGGVPAR